MNVPSRDSSDPAAVRRLRRCQIAGVALGSCGGLMFLIGLSGRWYWLSDIGLALFALAFAVVLVAGAIAWWKYG